MKGNRKGGRPLKIDPAKHRYVFYLTDQENARFLSMLEQSGMKKRAHFVTARIFKEEFKVLKIDKNALEYYSRLTNFYGQFRAIGVNYNQVVKALNANFTEKKALAFLYKLENATKELVGLSRKIIDLTNDFERKFLKQPGHGSED